MYVLLAILEFVNVLFDMFCEISSKYHVDRRFYHFLFVHFGRVTQADRGSFYLG